MNPAARLTQFSRRPQQFLAGDKFPRGYLPGALFNIFFTSKRPPRGEMSRHSLNLRQGRRDAIGAFHSIALCDAPFDAFRQGIPRHNARL